MIGSNSFMTSNCQDFLYRYFCDFMKKMTMSDDATVKQYRNTLNAVI